MSHAKLSSGECATEQEAESSEALQARAVPRRCRQLLPVAVAAAALLAVAGAAALRAGGGAATAARRSAVSMNVQARRAVLNKTGTGCENTATIRFASRAVGSVDECAALCSALLVCKQFNYNPAMAAMAVAAMATDPEAGNCALMNDWCHRAPADEWELYDDVGEKTHNDAAAFGYDSKWSLHKGQVDENTQHLFDNHGNDIQWLFEEGRAGCARDRFECPIMGVTELVAAGPPPQSTWKDAFEYAVTGRRKPGDRCCEEDTGPRVFAGSRLSGNGLGSRLNNFANEVLWAMWAGLPLSLCTPPFIRDSWPLFFQDVEFARCNECGQSYIFESAACAGGYASRMLDEDTLFEMKRFVYSRLFKFQPDAEKRRADLMKNLSLVGVPFVGVHIRRGDKISEVDSFLSATVFAQKVREQCAKFGNQTCRVFVASDSPEARDELQKELPGATVVAQGRLPPEMYAIRNTGAVDDASQDLSESSFVLDLSMLVQSDAFIGTGSSNVGRWVHLMRPKEKPSVSVDNEGSFFTWNC